MVEDCEMMIGCKVNAIEYNPLRYRHLSHLLGLGGSCLGHSALTD